VKAAALFDVDKTLVNVNTVRLYVRWRMGRREAGLRDYATMTKVLFRYAFGLLDPAEAAARGFRTIIGYEEARMREECRTWYAKVVRPHISKHGRRTVERWQRGGTPCALLTAATPYLAEPLAEELGIPHVICTRLTVLDGRFTGGWQEPLCYGPGKLHLAQAWAREHGIDLAKSAFYTDSISDLPVLEAVGLPRVVNPDPRLFLAALRRGYPIESWR
jgi:HAD superfamily hydrolase (TIGR01490 family)